MMSRILVVVVAVAVAVVLTLQNVAAWSINSQAFQQSSRRKPQQQVLSPCTNVVEHTVQVSARDEHATQHYMLREGGLFQDSQQRGVTQTGSTSQRKSRTITFSHSLSRSASAFMSGEPVAHGLLSPHTVARLEELTRLRRHSSPALDSFLDSYYSNGPMSCVPMLSDPSILPHLTSAMRDIAV